MINHFSWRRAFKCTSTDEFDNASVREATNFDNSRTFKNPSLATDPGTQNPNAKRIPQETPNKPKPPSRKPQQKNSELQLEAICANII